MPSFPFYWLWNHIFIFLIHAKFFTMNWTMLIVIYKFVHSLLIPFCSPNNPTMLIPSSHPSIVISYRLFPYLSIPSVDFCSFICREINSILKKTKLNQIDVKPYYGILKVRFISFSLFSYFFFSFAVEMFASEQTMTGIWGFWCWIKF